MRHEPIKDPRRIGQHVSVIMDDLAEGGARDIRVFKTKHLAMEFELGPQTYRIVLPCTPRDPDISITLTRQRLKRLFGAVLRERAA